MSAENQDENIEATTNNSTDAETGPWYEGITGYQWLVLVIASLGWVFDIFEGQYFVASMNEAMPSLVAQLEGESTDDYKGRISYYNNIAFGCFLLGGAIGGIFFGMLSDRIGRKKAMTYTILFYSLFTCVSAFSQAWWHLAGLRFLVAMGVGGEWAVASSMVFEVFPKRARAHVGGIFHASSVIGTWLAIAAGAFIIGNPYFGQLAETTGIKSLPWRIGFALGALPAFLIIWIRATLREPESWQQAKDKAAEDKTQQVGNIGELFSSQLIRNTLVGFSLAAVGMATFWGVHIYGKNLMKTAVEKSYVLKYAEDASNVSDEEKAQILTDKKNELKRWEMLGMFLTTTGGGLGLVLFGPISQAVGRKTAFLVYHVGGLLAAVTMFQGVGVDNLNLLSLTLPVFGFLTLGMHAGYAIYFPELFPTRLRGSGTGFCFNAGRIAAAPILFLGGWMQKDWGYSLEEVVSLLSLLYLLGVFVLIYAPETRGKDFDEGFQEVSSEA